MVTMFDLGDVVAFFVQQVRCNIDRNLGLKSSGAVFERFFLENTKHLNRTGFGVTNSADTVAARAGDVAAFVQRRTKSLAGEFQQAKAGNLGDLDAGSVVTNSFFDALFDSTLMGRIFHIDEVDDDQAAEVTQTHLTRNFFSSFFIGVEGSGFDVSAGGGAGGVNVDGNQSFSVVDHNRAARGEGNGSGVGRFDLIFDLEAGEQGHIVRVALDTVDHVRHDVAHELLSLFVDVVGVNENFSDVRLEVVADRANHEIAFFNDQEGGGINGFVFLAERTDGSGDEVAFGVFILRCGSFNNGLPELEKVIKVPFEFFDRTADTSGTSDEAHAFRCRELGHVFTKLFAFFAFDTTADTASARIVRHKDEVATGQGNESGQCRTLVAAFFFFNLNDELGSFGECFFDGRSANINTFFEVRTGNFFKREKTVAFFAVIDETCFQRRFNTGDYAFVDIGLSLLTFGTLDININELLTFNNSDTQLLSMRGVK